MRPNRTAQGLTEEWESNLATVTREVLQRERSDIGLTPDAQEVWFQFSEELEPRLKQGAGDLAVTLGWGHKLAGASLRIAGILHVAESGPNGVIGAETMSKAIDLAKWFIPQAVHMFTLNSSSNPTDSEVVLRYIEDQGKDAQVSARDIQQNRNRFRGNVGAVKTVLNVLVEAGRLVEVFSDRSSKSGRAPEPRYMLK